MTIDGKLSGPSACLSFSLKDDWPFVAFDFLIAGRQRFGTVYTVVFRLCFFLFIVF
jgi:hypothetical protein